MITIYALIDPRDGKVFYIGRTSDMKHRLLKHNSVGTAKGTPKNVFIREIRAAGFRVTHIVLDEVNKSEGKFWETFYTDLYRSWGFNLLNNLYHKMGNQTSFQPNQNLKPVVAVDSEGKVFKRFESVKSVYTFFGRKICVPQCLMGIKKRAGGYTWFFEKDFDSLINEEIINKVKWANTRSKVITGYKKGSIPHNKVIISEEKTKMIIDDYKLTKAPSRVLAERHSVSRSVILRTIKTFKL